ncbi:MAG: AcrR family transcriptional regulator, partial [Halieaceae bacterium]
MQAAKQSYHRGDLRAKLIDSAKQILQTDGLAALSLRKIARDVGVAPSA